MEFTETHLEFYRLLNRLRKIDWNKQFQTLKVPEFLALDTIYRHHADHPDVPGMYVSAFAETVCVTMPTASKLLKSLEAQGWITRSVDKNNRRNTFIILTEAGRALYLSERRFCAQTGANIFSKLGEENTAALLAAVTQILDVVEEEFQENAQCTVN